jgi:hypothetical protein
MEKELFMVGYVKPVGDIEVLVLKNVLVNVQKL